MILNQLKKHDRYRFEMKLSYSLRLKKKYTDYDIEAYFFVPVNLDINSLSYRKDNFYRDMQTYIRFSTPVVVLNKIIGGPESPFEIVKEACVKIGRSSYRKQDVDNFESQIKMFGAIMKSSLRDHVRIMLISRNKSKIKELLDDYLSNVQRIREVLNEQAEINASNTMKKSMQKRFLFIDEYVSLNIEYQSFRICELLRKGRFLEHFDCKDKLFKIINDEINHRKEKGYTSIISDIGDNEEFLHRFGMLKKYASSILYLNTRYKKEGQFTEHLALSFASAFAMLVATGIAFVFKEFFGFDDFTTSFFLVLVVSYIFKDRIKEILRYYFSDQLKRFLYDFRLNIFSNKRNKIGINREDFEFIDSERVPREISRIRNKYIGKHLKIDAIGEEVMLYRKHIRVYTKKIKKFHENLVTWGITDISRFNVVHLIRQMDNPVKKLYKLSGDNELIKKVDGMKMYHVDMVIKYSMDPENLYRHYRLVLNRDGIVRIEDLY